MRKLLNTVYVTNEMAYLTLDGENLVCKIEGETKLRLSLIHIFRTWIKQYNNHEDLTDSRKEGVYLMAKNGARKNTTLEERRCV